MYTYLINGADEWILKKAFSHKLTERQAPERSVHFVLYGIIAEKSRRKEAYELIDE